MPQKIIKKETHTGTQNQKLTKHMEHVKSISSFTESNKPHESIGLSSSNVSEQSPNMPGMAFSLGLVCLKLM